MPQTEKMISWILKGGLFATPFLVFIVTRSLYFPFITGKNFAFRILVEFLAVVWVFAALRLPRFRPHASLVMWTVSAFILITALATAFSLSPYRSFWSNFERMEGFIGLTHLALYFFLLTVVFRNESDWRTFFATSIGASVIVAFYALLQLAGVFTIHQGGTRVDATFGNATYLATYLVFHIFFILWFFLKSPNRLLRAGLAVAALAEAVVLYYTATRGAIIGLLGGLFIGAVLVALLTRGTARRMAQGGIIVALLLPMVFFLIRDTSVVRRSPVLARFATISFQEVTTQSRFIIWKIALKGWLERPILGWGPESFIHVFSKHYQPELWRQEPWFDRAHNVVLDLLVAAGILGAVAYLAIHAALVRTLIRAFRANALDVFSAIALGSLIGAYLIQSIFVFDNLMGSLALFALFAYVHFLATRHGEEGKGRVRPARGAQVTRFSPQAVFAVELAVVVVAALVLYAANVKPLLASKLIIDGLAANVRLEPAGKVDASIAVFQRVRELGTFGTIEMREQLAGSVRTILQDASLAVQDKQKYLDYAISELEVQQRDYPEDVRAMVFLESLYLDAGRPAEALDMIVKAIAVSERRALFHALAGEAYLFASRGDDAIRAFGRALELTPDSAEALSQLVSAAVLAGKEEEMEAVIAERTGGPLLVDFRVSQAYVTRGQYRKAARILEDLVAEHPEAAIFHLNLGLVYADLNRFPEAYRELQEAATLEPEAYRERAIEAAAAVRQREELRNAGE